MTFFTRAGSLSLFLLLMAAQLSAVSISRDGVLVSSAELVAQTTAATDYWLEAECAEVGAGWKTVTDDNASGGSYVFWPGANSLTPVPADLPKNQVRFTIHDAEAGSYRIFGRVLAVNNRSDSFWVRVNGGTWYRWWQGFQKDGQFHWHQIQDGPYQFKDGVNTIEFAYREPNTILDKIYVTSSDQLPQGLGEAATFDCTPEPALPTAVAHFVANAPFAPATVQLDASRSFDPDGTIVSYEWAYEGGTVSGARPTIVVQNPNQYTFTLTVTDNDGLPASTTMDLRINSQVSRIDNEYWLEAECAEVGSAWRIDASRHASSFEYVQRVKGSSNAAPPADEASSRVRFTIDGAEAGNYHLFARAQAPTTADNSFWVRVNEGKYFRWDILKRSRTFQWNAFDVEALTLTEGTNTIDIAYREDGTLLDKILVKPTADLPAEGFGFAPLNCGPVARAFGCESDLYDPNTLYEVPGNQVLFEGSVWENQFPTAGASSPAVSDDWRFIERCVAIAVENGCSAPEWEAAVRYDVPGAVVRYEGDVYESQVPTEGDEPSRSANWAFVETCAPATVDCSFIAHWSPDEDYFEAGIEVVHEGILYVSTDASMGVPPNESTAFDVLGTCEFGTDEQFRTTPILQQATASELDRSGGLQVYPTVTAEQFNVQLLQGARVTVFDGSGRNQADWNLRAGVHQLSLRGARPGMYYVRSLNADGTQGASRLIIE